jgi:hypothetical protein
MRQALFRLTSGFAALLVRQGCELDDRKQLESIRKDMLGALQALTLNTEVLKTVMDIHRAPDIHSLWYLRTDLHQSLATFHCEEMAHQSLHDITAKFRGHVPKNLMRSSQFVPR